MSNAQNPFETFDFGQFYTRFMNTMNECIPQDFAAVSSQQKVLMHTFTKQIQLFYKLLEKTSDLITSINDVTVSHEDKKKQVAETLLLIQKEIDDSNIGPFALWENFSSVLGNNNYLFNNTLNPFEQYFNLPSIGYTREQQEKMQKGMQLWKTYQKNLSRYESTLKAISMTANRELTNVLYCYIEEEKPINNLREIYDMWIEVNEKHYAEYVVTEEHSLLYGELVNSLMKLKQFINKNMDELLQLLNLPTQSTMNTVLIREKNSQKKIFELQQELKNIQRIINSEKEQPIRVLKKKAINKKKITKKTMVKKTSSTKKVSKKKKISKKR